MSAVLAVIDSAGTDDSEIAQVAVSDHRRDAGSDVEERILDAALALVSRWGVAKTLLGDVAGEAGCSRATVYRAFPGGKSAVFQRLGRREVAVYVDSIIHAIDAAPDLETALTDTLVTATRELREHAGAQFVFAHEPGLLLPFLGFDRVEVLYRHAAATIGPHLERFLTIDRAAWAAEWAVRVLITYVFNPADDAHLANVDHARQLVATFMLPALSTDRTHQGDPS